MELFFWITGIYIIIQGAVFGRADGSGLLGTSEWTERTLIMLFFVLGCVPFAGWWGALAYAGVVGIATGHGQYFLSRAIKEQVSGKEKVDPFVSLFFGKDPRDNKNFIGMNEGHPDILKAVMSYGFTKLYWRNVLGMFSTGFLVGLPASVVAVCFGEYTVAGLFLLTGLVKAVAYVLGDGVKRLFPKVHDTVIGEYANGAGRNILFLLVIFHLISTGVFTLTGF